jgi:flavorubredoxin
MNTLLQSINTHKKSQKLKLSGKIGGVFGSYGWDGGWVVEILREEMEDLGIEVVAPTVSLVDGQGGRYEIYLSEDALNKCRQLGRTVAEKAIVKG